MGSPLGPTLSNFHIARVENKILNNFAKSTIYVRYIGSSHTKGKKKLDLIKNKNKINLPE